MKRRDLIAMIDAAARDRGLDWRMLRQGAGHQIWELDGLRVVIPRHREVNEVTAGKILRLLAELLEPGWWRT